MRPFAYMRAESVAEAIAALAGHPGARLLAGGTNLVDLMKCDVARPPAVVDITRLPLTAIEETEDGGLRIGALVSNAALSRDPRVAGRYPLLAGAILAGASPQLRNAATAGGNLLQRTRCCYFYDPAERCNKREPGAGCAAIGGVTRNHAILGASADCIATHPSDMCVALAALDAVVEAEGPDGRREIAFAAFHRLPGDRPDLDNTLEAAEVVTALRLPAEGFAANHSYLKIRDRLSYAFALVSAAAAMTLQDGAISALRVAMGGVAHKPWRLEEAEALCLGRPPDAETFGRLADRLLAGAAGQGQNDFKLPLARETLLRALSQAAAGTPQSQSDKAIA